MPLAGEVRSVGDERDFVLRLGGLTEIVFEAFAVCQPVHELAVKVDADAPWSIPIRTLIGFEEVVSHRRGACQLWMRAWFRIDNGLGSGLGSGDGRRSEAHCEKRSEKAKEESAVFHYGLRDRK